ncbi:DNA translocase SftA [Sporosarcina sp. NCCP-2716]|nr:DNA translocase SftA [Sporosarcina sp. NCCP-2716]
MITDAEIYGWEEETEQERATDHRLPLISEEASFERATPLRENKRWPAEQPIGEIHRAGSRQKYKETPEVQPPARRTPAAPVNRTESKPPQKPSDKRIHTPFKPTEVPSPVYGFSKPKLPAPRVRQKMVEHEIPMSDVRQPVKKAPDTETSAPEEHVIASHTDKPEAGKSGLPVQPVHAQVTEQQHRTDEALLDTIQTAEWVEEEHGNGDSPEELKAGPELVSMHEPGLVGESYPEFGKSFVSEAKPDHESESVPEPGQETELQAEPEPVIIVSDETAAAAEPLSAMEHGFETADEITDDTEPGAELILPAESAGEHTDETAERQEKIVPFNVLMLKSDKEKLRGMNSMPPPIVKKEPVQPPAVATHMSEPARAAARRMAAPEIAVSPEKEQPASAIAVAVAEEREPATNDAAEAHIGEDSPEPVHTEEEPLLHYVYPSMDDLLPPETQQEDTEWLASQSEKLVEALSHFSVRADILEAVQGPTVTRFELTVGFGTKVSKVRNLTDDLKLALAAEDIRIQAPIPGTSSIGIEIPNRTTRPVRISEVIGTEQFTESDSPLEAVLGLSLTGEPVTLDLRKMPHGMIAGATGSGKSVCINSILVSLLYKASPAEVKLLLIDPKMVELAPFNGVPHLISPVITDVKAATAALKWAVDEMERRYELFAHAGARNIERYNQMAEESRKFSLKMPYLLIVIDELADLMMVAPADVEVSISRIAQKARACGIHLIIATQRPSVDVITGIIKANIPTRIAFAVSSQVDSRTIIDGAGAERLLGRGDMLYIGNGQSSAVRLQGTFVTDDEIEQIIEHVKNEASPEYLFGQEDLLAAVVEEEETDPLFVQACTFIIEQGSASTSLLQRHFSIGYNRAAKLMDRMETHGFISEQRGSRPRDVYVTQADLDAFLNPVPDA